MPGYPFLARRELRTDDIAEHLKALRTVGVRYTEDDIANALADLRTQAGADDGDARAFGSVTRKRRWGTSTAIPSASPSSMP